MNNIIVLCLISFALTIDYSLGLISLQAYWTKLGGTEKLVGFVFGLYDASTIFVTPLLALMINSNILKYKTVFMGSILINIIGNIFYGLANIVGLWIMIFIGRFISGVGAGSLPLLIVYIAETLSSDEQKSAVGYVKYTAAFTRIIGPTIGILLSNFKIDNRIFNLYTLAGWIPAVIGLGTLPILYFWKDNYNASYLEDNNKTSFINLIKKIWNIFTIFWPIILLGSLGTYIYWYFMGNSFIIATNYFNVVSNEHQLGNLYYSGLGGLIIAVVLYLTFKTCIPHFVGLVVASNILILSTLMFLFKFNIIFYIAVGMTTFGYIFFVPLINVQNNIIAKNYKSKLGKSIGISITALTSFQSLARFIGPASFTLFKHRSNNKFCNFSNPDNYITSGCEIKGYLWSSLVAIIVVFVLSILCFYWINKVIKRSIVYFNESYGNPINRYSSNFFMKRRYFTV